MRRSLCEQEEKQEDKKTTCEKSKQQTKCLNYEGKKAVRETKAGGKQSWAQINRKESGQTQGAGGGGDSITYDTHTDTHRHILTYTIALLPRLLHTMMAQSQVQTRACI